MLTSLTFQGYFRPFSIHLLQISNATDLTLINDAKLDASAIRLTNDTIQYSIDRFFHTTKLTMKPNSTSTSLASFSTSFVFFVLPQIASSPNFSLCFVLSNYVLPQVTSSPGFDLFTVTVVNLLFAIEFDIGRNIEFNDSDGNHIGINLNNIILAFTRPVDYYNSSSSFFPVQMRSGENVRTRVEFDGDNLEINVTVAPTNLSWPSLPTLSFKDPIIVKYESSKMFVRFLESKKERIEAQRVLAWSFSRNGVTKEINMTNFSVFELEASLKSLSKGAVARIIIACAVFVVILAYGVYLYWRKKKLVDEEDDEIEDWEMEYWLHRFSNEKLSEAIDGFSKDQLLGSGGFGKIYRGFLSNKTEIALKYVNFEHGEAAA